MSPGSAPRGAPTDAEWDAAIRARLTAVVPRLVPGAPAAAAVWSLAPDVWQVALSDGGCLVAKHQLYGVLTRGEPHDLLAVELDALRRLRAAGCPVPVAFGADPDAQIILLEYAGPWTVAAALRSSPPPPPARRARWRGQVLRGLTRIEAALAQDGGHWATRIAPGATRADLARSWVEVGARARAGLRGLLAGRPAPAGAARALEVLVAQLLAALGRRPPTLGPTDYHMGNLVLDARGERLTFLELAKLGWDWTERRAVQYTTSPDGDATYGLLGLHGSLEPAAIAGRIDTGALDGHCILFHLLIAQRLCDAGRHDRAASLFCAIARPLAAPPGGDPLTRDLRHELGRIVSSRNQDG